MIIETQVLQERCKKILEAVGNKKSLDTETLELIGDGNTLSLTVANKEYNITAKMSTPSGDTLHAVISALGFLNLITKTTTQTVELTTTEKALCIKGNGNYKIALIIDDKTGNLVQIPRATMPEVIKTFTIKNSILQSIIRYNGKVLQTSDSVLDVFYIDNEGALTVSSGACVNSFNLDMPVSIVLSDKVVRLFKLFKSEDITFELGIDESRGKAVQKVCFKDNDVCLISLVVSDTNTINNFPVRGIRQMANYAYPYNATVDKSLLMNSIERLSLFGNSVDSSTPATTMKFGPNSVSIFDAKGVNMEVINYVGECPALADSEYEAAFNTKDLLLILGTCDDEYVTMSFGYKALMLSRNNIKNILPEKDRR